MLLATWVAGCGDDRSETATEDPEQSSSRSGAREDPRIRLEYIDRLERAKNQMLRGDHESARHELERLAELVPGDPEVLFQQAKLVIQAESRDDNPPEDVLRQAVQYLEQARKADAVNVKVCRLLGDLYLQLRLPESAAWMYLDVVRAHPDLLEFYLPAARHMGLSIYRYPGALSTRSLFEERVKLLERVLDAYPMQEEALLLLADSYFAMGDVQDAERFYLEWLTRFAGRNVGRSRVRRLYRQVGATRFWDGRFGAAEQAYRQAVDLTPPGRSQSVLWNHHLSVTRAGTADLPEKYRLSIAARSEEPLRTVRFADVSEASGVNKLDGAGPSAWGDLDGDGIDDLFVSGCNTYSAVYLGQRDGTFRNATRECGLADMRSGFSSLLGDIDNDGDLDLYVIRDGWFGPAPNALFQNRDGVFHDITRESGAGDPGSGFTGSFWDYDSDGWLDLVVANGIVGDGSTNQVYRNTGQGTFENTTQGTGLLEAGDVRTIGLACLDYDKDGDVDLFCNGYLGPNRLFQNQGNGTFVDVTVQAGVQGSKWELGYVVLVFDHDNDTWPDIFSVQYEHSYDVCMEEFLANQPIYGKKPNGQRRRHTRVFRNSGDGTFAETTRRAGFLAHGAMGGNFGDVNGDGWIDVYLGTGGPAMDRFEPNALYINRGDGHFAEIGWPAGVGDIGKGHGVTFADFDRDGDLDIYSPQGGAYHGDAWENRLYRNDSPGPHHWASILLHGTRSNGSAIGAQLTLTCGERKVYQEIQGGSGFGSTNSLAAEFSLGPAESIDSLHIRWPSGEEQTFASVPVDQFLEITEGKTEIDRRTFSR